MATARTFIDRARRSFLERVSLVSTKFFADGIAQPNIGQLNSDRLVKVSRVALAAVDTGGGVLSWRNPEAVSVVIERLVIDVTTASSGACTVDFGTTAVSGTTSSNNLITGVSVATAGTFDNITDISTSGKSRQKVASGAWVTGSKASGASAGLVGFAYVHYFMA